MRYTKEQKKYIYNYRSTQCIHTITYSNRFGEDELLRRDAENEGLSLTRYVLRIIDEDLGSAPVISSKNAPGYEEKKILISGYHASRSGDYVKEAKAFLRSLPVSEKRAFEWLRILFGFADFENILAAYLFLASSELTIREASTFLRIYRAVGGNIDALLSYPECVTGISLPHDRIESGESMTSKAALTVSYPSSSGRKELIEELCKKEGYKLNGYVKRLICNEIGVLSVTDAQLFEMVPRHGFLQNDLRSAAADMNLRDSEVFADVAVTVNSYTDLIDAVIDAKRHTKKNLSAGLDGTDMAALVSMGEYCDGAGPGKLLFDAVPLFSSRFTFRAAKTWLRLFAAEGGDSRALFSALKKAGAKISDRYDRYY